MTIIVVVRISAKASSTPDFRPGLAYIQRMGKGVAEKWELITEHYLVNHCWQLHKDRNQPVESQFPFLQTGEQKMQCSTMISTWYITRDTYTQ